MTECYIAIITKKSTEFISRVVVIGVQKTNVATDLTFRIFRQFDAIFGFEGAYSSATVFSFSFLWRPLEPPTRLSPLVSIFAVILPLSFYYVLAIFRIPCSIPNLVTYFAGPTKSAQMLEEELKRERFRYSAFLAGAIHSLINFFINELSPAQPAIDMALSGGV